MLDRSYNVRLETGDVIPRTFSTYGAAMQCVRYYARHGVGAEVVDGESVCNNGDPHSGDPCIVCGAEKE